MSTLEREGPASHSADGPACPQRPVLERIPARNSVLGAGMTIRRALPTRARRMVGAWCFLDHVGPIDHGPGQGMNVGPHPHIGLQTFTWMIEGEALHRDSLGYEQVIRPGQVNLMTAGEGIVHSEESTSDAPGRLHLAQFWIALPEHARRRPPAFQHCPVLPQLEHQGFVVTVLAGAAFGEQAPPELHSPLLGLDLVAAAPARATVPLRPTFEHALLCLDGAVEVEGERIEPGTLLYLGLGRNELLLRASAPVRLLLIGGEPFAEEVLLWWNFVARTRDEVEQATSDWNAGRHFGEVSSSPLARLAAPSLDGLSLRGQGRA